MKRLANFLKDVENTAYTLYSNCASHFENDPKLSAFLRSLSDDEALHFHFMASAADSLSESQEPIATAILLDQKTKNRIRGPLDECATLLEENHLDTSILIEKIVESEYSEWNDIFVYVVENLTKIQPTFGFAASRMQAHYKRMRRFFEDREEANKLLGIIDRAPPVWQNKLLIVDDEPILRNLLSALFKGNFQVTTAANGNEAMQKANASYYDMVLSDIDMPVMDGIEFYKALIQMRPEQKESFAFMTGRLDDHLSRFIESQELRVFEKPFQINALKSFINESLEK